MTVLPILDVIMDAGSLNSKNAALWVGGEANHECAIDDFPDTMKILVICPTMPFPLTDGGRRSVFHPLAVLAGRKHRIELACFAESDDPLSRKALEQICHLHLTRKSTRVTAAGALRSLLHFTPFLVGRFEDPEHLRKILDVVRSGVDLVQIEGLHAAYYGIEIKKRFSVPVILRHQNLASMNLSTYLRYHRNRLTHWFLRLELFRLRRYEKYISGIFDRFLMITREDEQALHELAPGAATCVIPAGVDTGLFAPAAKKEHENSILWLGSLQWPPNLDSLWWFYREIFPLVLNAHPSATLSIAGSNPPESVLYLDHPRVRILGFVDDVRPVMQNASVCVVPLRSGSGMRIKLLEMFAMRKAVVSTSLGCEGLDVRENEHVSIADTAEDFARAVVALLEDPAKRRRLGVAARRHVRRHFTWNAVVDQYEQVYRDVQPNRAGRKKNG